MLQSVLPEKNRPSNTPSVKQQTATSSESPVRLQPRRQPEQEDYSYSIMCSEVPLCARTVQQLTAAATGRNTNQW